jgi:PIN domain nuclease of toxin-antitoxin system
MAAKHRLGKLQIAAQALTRVDELMRADGFEHLSIRHDHAVRAGSYAVEHRDPFDRMLAAQSAIENATLVSLDPAFALFGTRTLW